MEAGCAVCAAEARAAGSTAAALAFDAEPVAPPAGLRDRILSALPHRSRPARAAGSAGRQIWREWPSGEPRPLHLVRSGDGEWEDTGFPGVRARRLYVAPDTRRVTMMVRMEPGSSYPSHRHVEFEECYVLEGDLRVGDEVLHAGDYQVADAESVHGVQSTEGGCLLLLSSSSGDELLS